MAKKKAVEVNTTQVSSLTDKTYHILLVEHLTLCELWYTVGRTAAANYPDRLTKKEANMYKLTIKLGFEAEAKFNEIVKLNLQPQPEHRLIPMSRQALFPKDTDAEKWLKELSKKLQELTKQCEEK